MIEAAFHLIAFHRIGRLVPYIFLSNFLYMQDKVNNSKQDLQHAENKYDEAIGQQRAETHVFELRLDIQNIRRKLLFFQERLRQLDNSE